ncbi:MAG: type I-U CRISPR-associated protein Cas7, partial [Acidimicrobiales bacterium]
MDRLTVERLVAGCADDSFDAGLTIRTVMEPLLGAGAPVKPAVYEGGRYQVDRRWWTPPGGERAAVEVVVIDNVASQANRLEAALLAQRERLGLPELVLDLSAAPLPAHLPTRLSSFLFPHRNADAYLRDAARGEKSFLSDSVGKALFAASAENPAALFEWM